ncbi:methyl-accepting chemotaxis protein [Phreatobacter oligotrophus]|uniref:Methyl-accepting chemotaxis protein n=1 Tax=Phreatobacter oligotrophus TaxID=1122261 RepID=A0A2T4YXV3_9HYPH|nr:methyl-accepting chemotaxis protein [Phreatobacter oligotrophus]PTM51354.1 methyl-accepting chemotaxis protein [Phreatobacter oligotrophus]
MARMPSLSIRMRIALLALAPIAGVFAAGGAAWYGQKAVAEAFEAYEGFSGLASDAARVRAAVRDLRFAAVDYAERYTEAATTNFSRARMEAMLALGEARRKPQAASLQGEIEQSLKQLGEAGSAFDLVRVTIETLGTDDTSGLTGRMNESVKMLEDQSRRVAQNFDDGAGILEQVLQMRRHEKDFMLRGLDSDLEAFRQARTKFINEVNRSVVAPATKAELLKAGEIYWPALDSYVEGTRTVEQTVKQLDTLLTRLDQTTNVLVSAADAGKTRANDARLEAQSETQMLMIGIIAAAVVLCGIIAMVLGRSMTRQLGGITAAMRQLAGGDTSVVVPSTEATDELGEMARAVLVFRDNALERERLAAEQIAEVEARNRRATTVDGLIRGFEDAAEKSLGALRSASGQLDGASDQLDTTSSAVTSEAVTASGAMEQAAASVSSAAAAAEELAASIAEIASQAGKSTQVADTAVAEAERTAQTMGSLAQAASRIGEVVNLIQAIAGQTNLLALNATIEAARAGEAGKGFAVVASEVKSLASQTAKATEEIASQIGAIQMASGDAVDAIEKVNQVIGEMRGIAASVAAAVEEQNAAVATIAEAVNRASDETRGGAEAMGRVGGTAQSAQATAEDVRTLSGRLGEEAQALDLEIRSFLEGVRAA